MKLPHILLAWGLSLIIGCILCYQMGYRHGVEDTQAEMQNALMKATEQSIAKAQKDMMTVNETQQHYESEVAQIRTQTQVVYKPIYEHTVCKDNIFSKDIIDLLNRE